MILFSGIIVVSAECGPLFQTLIITSGTTIIVTAVANLSVDFIANRIDIVCARFAGVFQESESELKVGWDGEEMMRNLYVHNIGDGPKRMGIGDSVGCRIE